ncbi:uncharacterized protein LOC144861316 isoform X2 [Branchiostoma floridae x Branchiostoma japonicum]
MQMALAISPLENRVETYVLEKICRLTTQLLGTNHRPQRGSYVILKRCEIGTQTNIEVTPMGARESSLKETQEVDISFGSTGSRSTSSETLTSVGDLSLPGGEPRLLPSSLEQTVEINKGNSSLGLTVNPDKEGNGIIVKSITHGGAISKDGRITVGDVITAVNGESTKGLNIYQAKALLRRQSLLGGDIR